MANIGNHEIFFGAVISGRQEDVLPSWFLQNVDPINDLKTTFGADTSDIFVDICVMLTQGLAKYAYYRCYCDTEDSLRINKTAYQLFFLPVVSGPKICYREIGYTEDGAISYTNASNWEPTSQVLSNIYGAVGVLYKGHSFCVSDGSDWAQWMY